MPAFVLGFLWQHVGQRWRLHHLIAVTVFTSEHLNISDKAFIILRTMNRGIKRKLTEDVKEGSLGRHWSMGLQSSMTDPELRVSSDRLTVTIKDKYPKVLFILVYRNAFWFVLLFLALQIGIISVLGRTGSCWVRVSISYILENSLIGEIFMHELST